MLGMMINLIKGVIAMLKYPFIIAIIVIGVFTVLVWINIAILYKQGKRFKKGLHKKIKKRSVFTRFFIDAPKQYALDMINNDPEAFKYKGCVIFTGPQGYGKTIAMIEFSMRMQEEYPLAKCISNLNYKKQNEKLIHWKQLINYKNGKKGVIVIMDETQNWFSSNQSRNFPPEMLSVITQNRKNRRILLGTAQSFHLLAKAIRSQATEVRECFTIANCITFVRRRRPVLDPEGNVAEWKNLGIYFFVHNEKLRNAYDTYEVIESLADSGFIDKDYLSEKDVVINIAKK